VALKQGNKKRRKYTARSELNLSKYTLHFDHGVAIKVLFPRKLETLCMHKDMLADTVLSYQYPLLIPT